MKVLALASSPRVNGNSDILLNQCIKGLTSKGATVKKVYLDKLDINPCKACDYCKTENIGNCIHNDDMDELSRDFSEADLWLFATPIYWWGPTAQLKLVMDRWYSFYKYAKLEDKKAAVIITMGASDYQTAIPTILMFEMAFSYLNMKNHQPLVVTAYEKGEVNTDKNSLEKAFNYGIGLA
ncbi:MAG: flavodoxin family protein [Clostridia bacterium]